MQSQLNCELCYVKVNMMGAAYSLDSGLTSPMLPSSESHCTENFSSTSCLSVSCVPDRDDGSSIVGVLKSPQPMPSSLSDGLMFVLDAELTTAVCIILFLLCNLLFPNNVMHVFNFELSHNWSLYT